MWAPSTADVLSQRRVAALCAVLGELLHLARVLHRHGDGGGCFGPQVGACFVHHARLDERWWRIAAVHHNVCRRRGGVRSYRRRLRVWFVFRTDVNDSQNAEAAAASEEWHMIDW